VSHPSEADEPAITITKRRRTKALTNEARIVFEALVRAVGWVPGETIPRVAAEVGLTPEQVRDAIFAPAADEWRAGLTERINAARYAP
jgi:hypothetical protein